MAYLVILKAATKEQITLPDLEERLERAGVEPHPKGLEDLRWAHVFAVPGGTLLLWADDVIEDPEDGEWARVRLSWKATRQDWESLLLLAEIVKGRIYDENIEDYLTSEPLDRVWELHQTGAKAFAGPLNVDDFVYHIEDPNCRLLKVVDFVTPVNKDDSRRLIKCIPVDDIGSTRFGQSKTYLYLETDLRKYEFIGPSAEWSFFPYPDR